MLISYAMPAVGGIGITGGTWLAAGGGAALFDGNPARRARLQWNAGGLLGSYVAISLIFNTPTLLRVFALLGSTLPPGVRVGFVGPGGAEFGGMTAGVLSGYQPDGTVGAWAIADADALADIGITLRIYNDCNGAPWAANGTVIDIGELWAAPAVEVAHGADWGGDLQDPTETTRTIMGQANSVRRSSFNVLDIPLVVTGADQVYGSGLDNGMSLMKLRAALAGDARCAVVVRKTEQFMVAQYGFGQLASIRHAGGDNFTGRLVHQEIPSR